MVAMYENKFELTKNEIFNIIKGLKQKWILIENFSTLIWKQLDFIHQVWASLFLFWQISDTARSNKL